MRLRFASRALIGRAAELAALEGVVADAAGGAGASLALVTGHAGLGKSRLVTEAQERARAAHGALVLAGDCLDLRGGEYPYAPIVAALRSGPRADILEALDALPSESRDEVARLVPELAPRGRAQVPRERPSGHTQDRLFEILLSVLRRLSEAAPVLLTVEDVHWVDTSTRDFLVYLAHNLVHERVALVLTYRDDEGASLALATDLGRAADKEIALEPLGRGEVEQLLDSLLDERADEALVDEVHARSDGNPFYVEELLAAGSAGGAGLPDTLREPELLRLEGLPEPAVAVARALAVIGRPAPEELLAAVTGLAVRPALRALLGAAAIRREGERFELRHALTREAILEELLPGECRELHAAVADALIARGEANAAELAWHHETAGRRESALAARIEAGRQAERVYGFTHAREHFAAALELIDKQGVAPPPDMEFDRLEVVRHLAEASYLTGDCEAAADTIAAALHTADTGRAWRLYERLGAYTFWDDDAALEAYDEALRRLPPGDDARRARVLSATAIALHDKKDWGEARERAREAMTLADRAGAAEERALARMGLGIALAFLGDPAGAETLVLDAQAIAERSGGPELRTRVYSYVGEVLRIRGRVGDALETMLAGEAKAVELGTSRSVGRSLVLNAAEDLLWLGRWDEAEERLSAYSRLELSEVAQLLHASVSAQLAVGRGRLGEADRHLAKATELVHDDTAADYRTAVDAAHAERALWSARPKAALERAGAALDAVAGLEDPLYTPPLYSLGARAAADVAIHAGGAGPDGLEARATGLVERLERLIGRCSSVLEPPQAVAHLALCRGELSRLRRAPDAAAWQDAAERFSALAQPYPAAYARWRQTEALLAVRGSRSAAAEALALAADDARRLGAEPLLAAIELRRQSARLRRPATAVARAASPSAPGGLTPRELEVLRLAARGRTAAQIADELVCSQRTVTTHLGHIFRKLDVNNRGEAVAAAHELGLLGARLVAD